MKINRYTIRVEIDGKPEKVFKSKWRFMLWISLFPIRAVFWKKVLSGLCTLEKVFKWMDSKNIFKAMDYSLGYTVVLMLWQTANPQTSNQRFMFLLFLFIFSCLKTGVFKIGTRPNTTQIEVEEDE